MIYPQNIKEIKYNIYNYVSLVYNILKIKVIMFSLQEPFMTPEWTFNLLSKGPKSKIYVLLSIAKKSCKSLDLKSVNQQTFGPFA